MGHPGRGLTLGKVALFLSSAETFSERVNSRTLLAALWMAVGVFLFPHGAYWNLSKEGKKEPRSQFVKAESVMGKEGIQEESWVTTQMGDKYFERNKSYYFLWARCKLVIF